MKQFDIKPDHSLGAVIDFARMVLCVKQPQDALQSIAECFEVSTVFVGRIKAGVHSVLYENLKTTGSVRNWAIQAPSTNVHYVSLSQGDNAQDVMVFHSAMAPLKQSQRDKCDASAPYFCAFWQSRLPRFEEALATGSIPATRNILHPDNPYELTRAEMRICNLISEGQRPKAMCQVLGVSTSTVRSHLRQVYAKTGLNGMVAVLYHIQNSSDAQDAP